MTSHPMFDITGRVALVTGSSREIGFAVARGLLEAGRTVVLNGRDPAALERAEKELSALGMVLAEAFDLTDSAAVADGVARVEDRAGPGRWTSW